MRRVLSGSPPANPVEADNDETEGPKLLCLPYVQGVSEKIERGCRKLGVQAVFKSGNKLRQSLMRVNTAIDEDSKKGVIYEVPCGECNQVYIGKTGRNLKERMREHQYAVKRKDMKNGIAAHVCEHQHTVDWSGAKVRCSEQRGKSWRPYLYNSMRSPAHAT